MAWEVWGTSVEAVPNHPSRLCSARETLSYEVKYCASLLWTEQTPIHQTFIPKKEGSWEVVVSHEQFGTWSSYKREEVPVG